MKKKVLIIGKSARDHALAKHLGQRHEVFVTPGIPTIKEFATCVDIRDGAINELLEFALENAIDLTIATSDNALNANIATVFTNNGLDIFAPTKNTTKLATDKCLAKKLLYKLRIRTPKFGIFEKQNMAADYIKNQKQPYVIKTNSPQSAIVLNNTMNPRLILDSLFTENNQRVLIEDYVWGTPFIFYTITDGYKALSIGSSLIHKHSLDGDGGQLTCGMGASCPNYKLSLDNEFYLMENIIHPTLEYFQQEDSPYLGILGINGILTENGNIQVLGYETFLQDTDCTAILENLDTNLYELMTSCINGSFSDEIDIINQKEQYSVSLVIHSRNTDNKDNIIQGLDNLDPETKVTFYNNITKNKYLEYEVISGPNIILTSSARTLARARKKVYDEVQEINFKGIHYRKDV